MEAGIIKGFDKLGRIVIPKDMRSVFELDDCVEIVMIKDGILLRNPKYILVEINKDTVEKDSKL